MELQGEGGDRLASVGGWRGPERRRALDGIMLSTTADGPNCSEDATLLARLARQINQRLYAAFLPASLLPSCCRSAAFLLLSCLPYCCFCCRLLLCCCFLVLFLMFWETVNVYGANTNLYSKNSKVKN